MTMHHITSKHLKVGRLNTCRLLMLMMVMSMQHSQGQNNGYFVRFTDKKGTTGSIAHPSEYLSTKAIIRRTRQHIAIDSSDLPVSDIYLTKLKSHQLKVAFTSKWMNGAILFIDNEKVLDTLLQLPFIRSIDLIMGMPAFTSSKNKYGITKTDTLKSAITADIYGEALAQIQTVNGQALHEAGYKGEEMLIAIIDAGFYKANELDLTAPLFSNGQIESTYDFVTPLNPPEALFDQNQHGMHVLSIIGGNGDGTFLGTAPEATFWLIRTEDVASEYPIEADYWICAAEKADSAGVDIINTSLGYSTFDNPSLNLTYSNLDGSSRISQAANMAVNKGMIVIASAGNEGNSTWKYITTPGDASEILTIGAMKADSTIASFSSIGPTADNRIKPDIVAMGYQSAIQSTIGSIIKGSGTSYAAPVITGLTACLWEAVPSFTAKEIIQQIKETANNSHSPNNLSGYGIPDFKAALTIALKKATAINNRWQINQNPVGSYLVAENRSLCYHCKTVITLYNHLGQLIFTENNYGSTFTNMEMERYPSGLYLLTFKGDLLTQTIKIIKK